ncbi:c-type cytochrome [Ancylobacter amanitiformis]|uniref:Mono/diheme cytochrome c family protein n=1 Tax=Ancylobacter amanitiformis TaxID=217069 RepID=A0ABU0LS60_9HYPH|nr:c-type cytochrome [Ancylobacter amanitiformis]MDQ0511524.1 mono/diheme cytochrome c family protein [Ancylobacter amanitiformis]
MRILGIIALAAASLALLGAAPAAQAGEDAVARGGYLVNAVMICGRCHTIPGPSAKPFAGGRMIETPAYTVQGSNITPDKATGIGAWSDEAIGRAITHGLRPDGTRMSASMPYGFYAGLTPADLAAIIAYLRALPPVSHAVAAPRYAVPPAPAAAMPQASGTQASGSADDARIEPGRYLGTLARCLSCHSTPGADGEPDLTTGLGRGGARFEGPWGVVVAPDITPRALAGWSDDAIRRALVEGITPDGRKLAAPMQAKAYAQLVPGDVDALIAWLRSLPAEN